MNRRGVLTTVDVAIPAAGLVIFAILLVSGRNAMAEGCLAGAVLASLDWLLLRVGWGYLTGGVKASTPGKFVLVAGIGIKFFLLAAAIYFIVNMMRFDTLGVVLGVSSLPGGLLVAAAMPAAGKETNWGERDGGRHA